MAAVLPRKPAVNAIDGRQVNKAESIPMELHAEQAAGLFEILKQRASEQAGSLFYIFRGVVMKILLCATVFFALALSFSIVTAQSPRARDQKPTIPTEVQPEPTQDIETLKIDTNLVTVPVIANSRTGAYIADVRKEEFKLLEDGAPQEIAFFATVNAPFHVVLLLDTSDSTQEKLGKIQQAAIAFLNQLGSQDKVKVISFDGELHDWNDFTSDKAILRSSIEQTRSGHDTRVYDAVQIALDALRPIQQRKAIVIFTDGMD